jgi:micrococcal nuclease
MGRAERWRAVALLLAACLLTVPPWPAAQVAPSLAAHAADVTGGPAACRVVRVFDGDTIAVRCSGRGTLVRYIGIDAPETHHPTRGEQPGGREATALNERLVGGRWVRLETDVQRRDAHDRLLAYVWVREPGGGEVMVNARMLAEGHARLMTIPPNVRHAKQFVALQQEARRAKRGLWSAPPFAERSTPRR